MAPSFPAIYLLRSHFEHDLKELQRLEKQIDVVYNINEAELILGKIKSKARAAHELRKLGLYTEDVNGNNPEDEGALSPHSKKRRKLDKIVVDGNEVIALDSETESGSDTDIRARKHPSSSKRKSSSAAKNSPTARKQAAVGSQEEVSGKTINVLKLEWYIDSVKNGHLLPFENYLVYEGRVIPKPKLQKPEVKVPVLRSGNSILARAKADSPPPASRRPHKAGSRAPASPSSQRPHLLSQTTTDEDLPPIPEYLHTIYSCQRPTPLHGPNDAFLSQLRIIKKARTLTTGDDKNVHARAYNAAVATIASYPYTLTSAHEVTRLPNCGKKLATLWEEWTNTGHIKEVDDIENDDHMKSLNIFYEIHDVAEKNARKFYNNGWRDLDDVVEYGCMGAALTRNQQIGVKYYEEFKQRIPRDEVERTAKVVLDHANEIHPGFQMVICGGYRRGKPDSGDVDVVLTHPDEDVTENFLRDLLANLETHGWVTHQLEVSTTNSDRGQTALNWKGGMTRSHGGFDTLDHGFVVWQDPKWPSMDEDLKDDPEAKNPNLHRRVDIIISPWKTAGCAIVGWSGGTMFERDIRRYCREKKGFKFDSTGVRRLDNGAWVDLEKGGIDLLDKEKKVFAGLDLEWREPTERCTD